MNHPVNGLPDHIFSGERKHLFVFCALIVSLVALGFAVYLYLPLGIDWSNSYRPAVLAFISGKSPYEEAIYFNPPWALIPLIPLAILPERIGYSLVFLCGICFVGYLAYELGAKPVTFIGILFSYPVLFMASYGQIDWLAMLGVLMPPQIGLFFVLMKPQIGLAISLYWLVEIYKSAGLASAIRTFLPVVLAFIVSFALYGFWPTYIKHVNVFTTNVNASLWPYSIPIGVTCLIAALRTRRLNLAMISSPFLFPYVAAHGWTVALLGLLPMQVETIMAVLAIWLVRLLTNQFLH
jgi:hypothetical protein